MNAPEIYIRIRPGESEYIMELCDPINGEVTMLVPELRWAIQYIHVYADTFVRRLSEIAPFMRTYNGGEQCKA